MLTDFYLQILSYILDIILGFQELLEAFPFSLSKEYKDTITKLKRRKIPF